MFIESGVATTRSPRTGNWAAPNPSSDIFDSSVNESNNTRNFVVIDNQLYFFDLFEIIYFIAGEVILNMEQTIDTLIEPHDASPTEIIIFKIISSFWYNPGTEMVVCQWKTNANRQINSVGQEFLNWRTDWKFHYGPDHEIGLHRCWWRMLETKCFGDKIWILVTSQVINIES